MASDSSSKLLWVGTGVVVGVAVATAIGLMRSGPEAPAPASLASVDTASTEPVAREASAAPPVSAPDAAVAPVAPVDEPPVDEPDDDDDSPKLSAEARARVLQGAGSSAGRAALAGLVKAAEQNDRRRGLQLLSGLTGGAPEAVEVRAAIDRLHQLAEGDDPEPALLDVDERLTAWQGSLDRSARQRSSSDFRVGVQGPGERFVAPGGKIRMKRRDGDKVETVERRVVEGEDGQAAFTE